MPKVFAIYKNDKCYYCGYTTLKEKTLQLLYSSPCHKERQAKNGSLYWFLLQYQKEPWNYEWRFSKDLIKEEAIKCKGLIKQIVQPIESPKDITSPRFVLYRNKVPVMKWYYTEPRDLYNEDLQNTFAAQPYKQVMEEWKKNPTLHTVWQVRPEDWEAIQCYELS